MIAQRTRVNPTESEPQPYPPLLAAAASGQRWQPPRAPRPCVGQYWTQGTTPLSTATPNSATAPANRPRGPPRTNANSRSQACRAQTNRRGSRCVTVVKRKLARTGIRVRAQTSEPSSAQTSLGKAGPPGHEEKLPVRNGATRVRASPRPPLRTKSRLSPFGSLRLASPRSEPPGHPTVLGPTQRRPR
jgi:hypothetical protein